jgi:predicted nucleic acid-binding protein
MAFVIDASVAAAWFLPDEDSDAATVIARRLATEQAYVPNLFHHEMRNLLVAACRRGRIPEDLFFLQLSKLDKLPVLDCGAGDAVRIAQLALAHSLTAYDATYLALALGESLPLATFDRELAAAAHIENVPILGFREKP